MQKHTYRKRVKAHRQLKIVAAGSLVLRTDRHSYIPARLYL